MVTMGVKEAFESSHYLKIRRTGFILNMMRVVDLNPKATVP